MAAVHPGARPNDEVRLLVPAAPEYLRLARVTASGLASRLGFTIDEVDDLRLAIDELCHTILAVVPPDGALEMSYTVVDDGLVVVGTARLGAETDGAHAPTSTDLSAQILSALVDEHDLSMNSNGSPEFRLVKRHQS